MDDTKLEELEKAYKKEKDYKIRIRMVTIRMVRVRNMSVNETADNPRTQPKLGPQLVAPLRRRRPKRPPGPSPMRAAQKNSTRCH